MGKRTPLANRLWSRVAKGDGCWEWQGHRNRKGYGQIDVRTDGHRRSLRAHRVAWTLTYGPIPKGMLVCHHCDNPPCCRPDHLFLGTKSTNAADMIRKARHWFVYDPGRRATGARAHKAKLTNEQVAEIRRLGAANWTQRAIAESLGTSQTTVWRILAGKSWAEM
jgi:hypothetical protein